MKATTTVFTDNLSFSPAVRGVSTAPVRKAWATVQEWRQRAREREQLSRLTPRLLKDIGVDPEEVWREVDKPFWRV